MSYMGTFRPEFEKNPTIIIFEMSTFQFIKMQSFMLRVKKIWDQNCFLLGVFEPEFENAIVIFEINTLSFIKNEFLTIIVSFGIGSA